MRTLEKFHYYGKAVGVDGQITRPISHVIDGHGRCGLPDHNPGRPTGRHDGHSVPGILSYDACHTEVHAQDRDADGFYRTEIRATVENLKVLGDFPLSADRITMGMVTVYRRHWYENREPPVLTVRVLPVECSLGNLTVNGKPAQGYLPAPFFYARQKREAYLTSDQPDPAVEAEVQKTINDSSSRFVHIPNFGRIFFGEWTIVSDGTIHPVHRISMLRLGMGSPVAASLTFGSGDGDGSAPPPR